MTFTRRQIMTAAAGLVPRLDAGPKKRPNILVLLTDDQRFSTLHAINNPEVQTPTMDRLASRGTTFTHGCIMGGTIPAVCSPAAPCC